MTLDQYLTAEKKNGLTEAAFAGLAGISQPAVNRLRKGHSWAQRDVLERVCQATDWKVTPNDFVRPPANQAASEAAL